MMEKMELNELETVAGGNIFGDIWGFVKDTAKDIVCPNSNPSVDWLIEGTADKIF